MPPEVEKKNKRAKISMFYLMHPFLMLMMLGSLMLAIEFHWSMRVKYSSIEKM